MILFILSRGMVCDMKIVGDTHRNAPSTTYALCPNKQIIICIKCFPCASGKTVQVPTCSKLTSVHVVKPCIGVKNSYASKDIGNILPIYDIY